MSFDRLTLRLLTALSVVFVTPAMGQYRSDPTVNGNYRDGQPMVMTAAPPPADPSIAISSRFRSAYARAKSPRIVIFWNRAFTDQVATDFESYTRLDSNASVKGSANTDVYRSRRSANADSSFEAESSASAEIRSGVARSDDSRRTSNLSEAVDFDVEQAYQNKLSQAGVRLIDRTSIMRTTGASRKIGAEGNIQELETDAILAKADIILEVTQMTDERVPGGMVYRIVVRDIRNSRILTSFSTEGRPATGRQPYVAGPNGFERARPRSPSPSDIGHELAVETMGRLNGAL